MIDGKEEMMKLSAMRHHRKKFGSQKEDLGPGPDSLALGPGFFIDELWMVPARLAGRTFMKLSGSHEYGSTSRAR